MSVGLITGGIALAKGISGIMANNRAKKALSRAKKMTPEEKEYKSKLQEMATKGDPNINSIRNRQISAIRQAGSDAQQNITGDLIQSGMENSVIASELRRKAGADVMRQVATTSQQIAERNRQFKDQAQGKLDQFNLNRSQYLKQLSMKEASIPTIAESILSTGTDILGGILTQGMTSQQNTFDLMKSLISSGNLSEAQIDQFIKELG